MNHLRYQLDGLTEALRKPYIKLTLQNIENTLVLDGFPVTRFFSLFHQMYTLHKPYISFT